MFVKQILQKTADRIRTAVRLYKRLRLRLRRAALRSLRRSPWVGPRMVKDWHKRLYERELKIPLSLDPPLSFNERITHRIFYDRDPRLKIVCDKLAVRNIIRERVGESFLVPLLGTWDNPDEIDWSVLPDRFVLKPSHSSGPIALVLNKTDRDPGALTEQAREWLRHDYFDVAFEWGYRDVPRRLIAERLLTGPDGNAPVEAHVLTFGGRGALIRVLTGVKSTPQRQNSWYDRAGTRLGNFAGGFDLSPAELSRQDVADLIVAAERAAVGFDHIRVDFYLTDAGLKIGELTPYHMGGRMVWRTRAHDEVLGRVWQEPHRTDLFAKFGSGS